MARNFGTSIKRPRGGKEEYEDAEPGLGEDQEFFQLSQRDELDPLEETYVTAAHLMGVNDVILRLLALG